MHAEDQPLQAQQPAQARRDVATAAEASTDETPEVASQDVAAATSGRAVVVSGITVVVAMAGMFLAGTFRDSSARLTLVQSSTVTPAPGSEPPGRSIRKRRIGRVLLPARSSSTNS